ncbi:hypothetical protein EOJ36_04075 [Sandaracinomonas limnophila]|uniref:Uncharacterized protein n=1 Tax=Sandaracinomonas limnophila TaxID=1862386 RepID=A0A437PTK3_9BACT|nr:hypothetical protein [Sandaracinomonas limnophila]RVU25603.1 hypothetical protein EOJ36_04075 [Sandaracinomonas limnophila]
MKNRIIQIVQRLFRILFNRIFKENIEQLIYNQGVINAKLLKMNLNNISKLSEAEFKVFSQWGDDGIIQYLINKLKIETKTFIEFGVENYLESNTRFLLLNDNWTGLIIDGSQSNIDYIQNDTIYWKHDITAVKHFINTGNINDILTQNGFIGDVGILHIDIDGNDYWIWKAIEVINPEIVIMEYNSILGCERALTIPYDPNFVRGNVHFSNLFAGSSLLSLYDLALEKGYEFVGCNSAGNNAYFIRADINKSQIQALDCKGGYIMSKFRESRNSDGSLNYNSFADRQKILKDMQFFNTRTNQIEIF